ncbi:endonuclease domain-containing 1 protein-like [Watersipora subatra]|uniref:endonuclease domain-containing 1 protein-like n=1 Tax=Watersipora subatra TaxID=2589382 RepID=UPI00355B2E4E
MKVLVVIALLAISTCIVESSTTDDSYLSSCNKFFYKSTAPKGFSSGSLKYICQRYEGTFHFATLYDTSKRIPLYSAYTIDEFPCSGKQPSRRSSWFIEPELAGRDKSADMDADKESDHDWVMPTQAINDDYHDSGFDRGHLNPNFHHCGNDRTATFSLTNSIPQDPCFNRIVWYHIEVETLERMENSCAFDKAKRYIIVGAVPSADQRIPFNDTVIHDKPDKATGRVNVPEYSWSMSCCDASDSNGAHQSSWSGVIAQNKAGGTVENFASLVKMERRLQALYGYKGAIKLLADGCGDGSADTDQSFG